MEILTAPTVVPSPDDVSLASDVPSDVGNLRCKECGLELTYSGRGRKPQYCQEHRKTTSKGSKGKSRKGKSRDGLEAFGGIAWSLAGYNLTVNAGNDATASMGRVMQLQGPDAGVRIARLIGPTLDKIGILDKIAHGGPAGDIAALIGPPLLVGVVASNPMLMQTLAPVMGVMLMPLAKQIAEQKAQQEAMMKTVMDDGAQEALKGMISEIFGGLDYAETDGGTESGTASDYDSMRV